MDSTNIESVNPNNDDLKLKIDDGVSYADIDFNKLLLNRAEKSQVVEAMVKPMAESLYNATPYDPYDSGFKDGSGTKQLFKKRVRHLREGITHKPNQFTDGSTNLGFKQGYYPVVMWTDHGTIYQPGNGWFLRWLDSVPKEDALRAGAEEAFKVYGGKQI